MSERAARQLQRARELLRTVAGGTWSPASLHVSVAHDAAESALRAILYARAVSWRGERRPDMVAREKKALLEDLWPQLEPWLEEYAWLWTWKKQIRRKRFDQLPKIDPSEARAMTDRATECATELVRIAESLVQISDNFDSPVPHITDAARRIPARKRPGKASQASL